VLSAHQGGGEPLRPMPLEITRCFRVLGAEQDPPPPPVRRGPGRVVVVDTPWPKGQACHSYNRCHLVLTSGCRRHCRRRLCGLYPQHVLTPQPRRLRAPCAACRACGHPSRERTPFFPSPRQASHCSRVRCNFPPTVIGPERGCGSSLSTTLRRHIASSIDIMEKSIKARSSERSACSSQGCNRRASRWLSPRHRYRCRTKPSSAAKC
jgi:hypothetical protein